jgi:hypothetical protein
MADPRIRLGIIPFLLSEVSFLRTAVTNASYYCQTWNGGIAIGLLAAPLYTHRATRFVLYYLAGLSIGISGAVSLVVVCGGVMF